MARRNPPPSAASDAVAAYIEAAAEPARTRIETLRSIIREEAPDAVERIAYGLPTWHRGENLLHLGAFARHVGVYPGPAAIEAFGDELKSFSTSKGAIQLPHDRDLPVDLVRRIVRWRLEHLTEDRPPRAKSGPKAPPRVAEKVKSSAREAKAVKLLSGGNPQIAKAEGNAPVQAYIDAMPGWKRHVGKRLDELIARSVPSARKAVKWNSPFYGIDGQGWFLSFHVFTRCVKVTFFRGTSLRPLPPGTSKHKDVRHVDIHEDDLDEVQMAKWVRQAAALPGWIP